MYIAKYREDHKTSSLKSNFQISYGILFKAHTITNLSKWVFIRNKYVKLYCFILRSTYSQQFVLIQNTFKIFFYWCNEKIDFCEESYTFFSWNSVCTTRSAFIVLQENFFSAKVWEYGTNHSHYPNAWNGVSSEHLSWFITMYPNMLLSEKKQSSTTFSINNEEKRL